MKLPLLILVSCYAQCRRGDFQMFSCLDVGGQQCLRWRNTEDTFSVAINKVWPRNARFVKGDFGIKHLFTVLSFYESFSPSKDKSLLPDSDSSSLEACSDGGPLSLKTTETTSDIRAVKFRLLSALISQFLSGMRSAEGIEVLVCALRGT